MSADAKSRLTREDTLSFLDLLGPWSDDSEIFKQFLHIPVHTAADSGSTAQILEMLHCEAAVLRAGVAQNAAPSEKDAVALQRLATTAALIHDINVGGLKQIVRRKGRGDRFALERLSQQSFD